MNIKNKNLLINKCYLNGAWVSSDKKIKVINPATGELIVEVPDFGKKETANAIGRQSRHRRQERGTRRLARGDGGQLRRRRSEDRVQSGLPARFRQVDEIGRAHV